MSTLLQISDPHFGTEKPPVVEALVRLAHEQRPELLVLSGDITQRARPEQFRAARRFVDRLHIPATLTVPGNHDIPLFNLASRLFMPYARYQREFGDELEPVFESEHLLVIGVRTTRRYRHVHGQVSAAQIERVAARLAQDSGGRLRIVVTHQPACTVVEEDRVNLLRGHREALQRWSMAGADIVMGGHIHRPYVCAIHDSVAGFPGRLWVVQAGTATSTRTRFESGNSINLIRYAGGGSRQCRVERWDYSDPSNRFELAREHELALNPLTERAAAPSP